MRKEVLWALLLAICLVAVLFAQRQLKEELAKPQGPELDMPFGEERISEGEANGSMEGLLSESGPEDEAEVTGPAAELSDLPPEVQWQLNKALRSFHQKQAVAQASAEELHDTPKVIRDAAEELAKVTEIEAQNPQFKPAIHEFYLSCARDDESLTVIRAQCLEKYMQRASVSEDTKAQLLTELPESVVRLFRAL